MTQPASTATAAPQFPAALSAEDIHVTPVARGKLVDLLRESDDEIGAVRIFVSGGGCGGMAYGMTFAEAANEYDGALRSDDLTLLVDAIALNYLRGAEIDYEEGPMGASFVFRNVFAAVGGSGACSACGAAGGGCA